MKQHILRILIVLLIIVGIGLVVYFLTKDNSTLEVSTHIATKIESDKELKDNLIEVSVINEPIFTENYFVYEVLENNAKYYSGFLIDLEINGSNKRSLDLLYKEYDENKQKLLESTNNLINYLNLQEQNVAELTGRKTKVFEDFSKLNKVYYKINNCLENLVTSRIYNGKNLNPLFNLTSCINILANSYLNTNNNFSLLTSVVAKTSALKNNLNNIKTETINFAINFSNSNKTELEADFKNYFETLEASSEINAFLTFLTSEAYYEEI